MATGDVDGAKLHAHVSLSKSLMHATTSFRSPITEFGARALGTVSGYDTVQTYAYGQLQV